MRTFRNSELRKLLEKDPKLRQALGFKRVPYRTQIGRRLSGLAPKAEQQIVLLGQQIVNDRTSLPADHSISRAERV
jgi:hypothetical protein